MNALAREIRTADLRADRAMAYKGLAKLEVATARRRFVARIGSPDALAALLGGGLFVGSLRDAKKVDLVQLEKRLDAIQNSINENPSSVPAQESDQGGVSMTSDIATFVKSLVTSLAARYLFAQFFTDEEPELHIDGDA